MRSVLVSDAHLRGSNDPNQSSLIAFLDADPAPEIVLGGDVFDAWWGFRSGVQPGYRPMFEAMRRWRSAGRGITWVRGNHDFHAGPAVEGLGVSVVDAWRRTAGDRRVVVVHGDSADRSLGQRALTRLLRGKAVAAIMDALGVSVGTAMARRLSGTSRTIGGPGLERLLDAQRALADSLLGEADVVCMGHSHAPGIETRGGGALINIGDWCDHHTFVAVDDDVRLFRWVDGRAEELDGPMRRRV